MTYTAIAPATETTLALVTRFENGFNARDWDATMADMTEDCVFEHVAPADVGFGRHEGADAVRAVWESMDEHFPGFTREIVEILAAGDWACCRFVLRWKGADGGDAAFHGVDVITVRDGKIAEKLTYGTLSPRGGTPAPDRQPGKETRMTTLVAFHAVEDGAHWARAWHGGPGSRQEMFGRIGVATRVLRDPEHPNLTGLIFEVPDVERFHSFMASDEVARAMREDRLKVESVRVLGEVTP